MLYHKESFREITKFQWSRSRLFSSRCSNLTKKRLYEVSGAKQDFRKQEENVIKQIPGNTAFTKQCLEVLNKKVTDLKKKLKFTKNNTEDKITDFKEKLAAEEKNMKSLGDYVKVIQSTKLSWVVDIEKMLVDLEDRSRTKQFKN